MNITTPTPSTWRTWTAATAVLLTTATLTAPAATPAAARTTAIAANTPHTALSCRAATPPGRPLTFTPALTLSQRTTRITATLRLTGCTTPNGHHPQLRSATLTLDGTARAGCSGASTPDGSARITWYNAQGHHTGTSTVQSTPRFVSSYNPGDALLSGRVTQGPLHGTRMTGTATPTSDVSGCAAHGLRTLSATGTLKFQ
ncbi:hypothetical protein [Streptomyces katrae]|uniref:hypothetical protein n=1 Tax=Streptomyces katrae TaxID=68223 RepID=UPI0004C28B25|nr:hypothetical protein [Streptomyces katrae]